VDGAALQQHEKQREGSERIDTDHPGETGEERGRGVGAETLMDGERQQHNGRRQML